MTADDATKEAAEAVRSHARLFDIAGQAVIGTTADGSIVYWSKAADKLYGWNEAEVMDRNIVDVTPADIEQTTAAEIMEQLRNGRGWSGEFTVRRRDGSEFRAHVRDVPVRDEVGRLIGIVGLSTPV